MPRRASIEWSCCDRPVLKTINFCFQKCATHWVGSGVHWCSNSSIVAKYSLSCFWPFVNRIEMETGPKPEKGLFTFGCSLFARFSVSTVWLARAKRLQPAPLTFPGQQAILYLFFICLIVHQMFTVTIITWLLMPKHRSMDAIGLTHNQSTPRHVGNICGSHLGCLWKCLNEGQKRHSSLQ